MAEFQQQVYIQPSIGVEGDFASDNPRGFVLGGPGGLLAEDAGVTVGRFAWIKADGRISNACPDQTTPYAPDGFVHRENNAQIVTYLASNSLVIQKGRPVALFAYGDFIARSTTTAARGDKVYADKTDGSIGNVSSANTVDTGYRFAAALAAPGLVKITAKLLG